jgi:hypothetical protein
MSSRYSTGACDSLTRRYHQHPELNRLLGIGDQTAWFRKSAEPLRLGGKAMTSMAARAPLIIGINGLS